MFIGINKKIVRILAVIFISLFVLASCSTNSSTARTARTAELTPCQKTSQKTDSQKIVSLSPTATEMLFAIGAGSSVIAVDDNSNYPEEAPNDRGLSGFNPNIESILSFQPDLVVVSSPRTDDAFQKLEELGICLVRQNAAVNLQETYDQISTLGNITGNFESAENLIDGVKTRISTLLERASISSEPKTYFYELDPTYYSVTENTFIGYVLGLLNLRSIAPDEGNAYPQLSQEAILTANPDIIFLADAACCGQSLESVRGRSGWGEIKAVQDGNIFILNEDIASRWGPRIVELLENVVNLLVE